MEFIVDIRSVGSYKRLNYKAWYAFAEFVDNSTQAYLNNKSLLDKEYATYHDRLCVRINYEASNDLLEIADNSIGMSLEEVERAMIAGVPPENPHGRSRYGLGMKTAACWFGDLWTVRTKKLGEDYEVIVKVDVDRILEENRASLDWEKKPAPKENHYTVISIKKLNRKLGPSTIRRIKDHLRSIYRVDLRSQKLDLFWQNTLLKWEDFERRLYVTNDGSSKKDFEFNVHGKRIRGWVGVLYSGSRRDAGFSILQNDRVIQGWPDAYRPESVFGEQEGGVNDLINQRVVGELFMDDFQVSHTKDSIVWLDDEEDIVEDMLGEICESAKEIASSLRVQKTENKVVKFAYMAVETIDSELKSNELKDTLSVSLTTGFPDDKAIHNRHINLISRSVNEFEPALKSSIRDGDSELSIDIFYKTVSEFEPYVLHEVSVGNNTLIILINLLHPFWQGLDSADSVACFIREAVYDGISSWKMGRLSKTTKDSFVYIKDRLLRVPMDIRQNSFSNT